VSPAALLAVAAAVSAAAAITDVRVLSKTGGKTGPWER